MKNTGSEVITEIQKLFADKGLSVVIIPHENPDGDAIGSALGIAGVLANIGHQVSVISPNDYPSFLKWFDSQIQIRVFDKEKSACKTSIEQSDLMICVDFNEPKRAGYLEKYVNRFKGVKILIDHHPYPTSFCNFTVSEPHYSSTAELIYDLVLKTGFEDFISLPEAEALFTGIMTDTGSFSHNISNPGMFRVVARLIEKGINTGKIQSNIYHNYSAQRMNLLGFCLNEKMEVFPEFRTAVISISKEEQEQFKFEIGDSEGFVNYPLSIKDIVFSALFIEKEGLVKASFRSKGNFPVNRFSSENFRGGGHLNAAGGESYLSLEDTLTKFRQLLNHYKHLLTETEI